jgi:hypothetical protein
MRHSTVYIMTCIVALSAQPPGVNELCVCVCTEREGTGKPDDLFSPPDGNETHAIRSMLLDLRLLPAYIITSCRMESD